MALFLKKNSKIGTTQPRPTHLPSSPRSFHPQRAFSTSITLNSTNSNARRGLDAAQGEGAGMRDGAVCSILIFPEGMPVALDPFSSRKKDQQVKKQHFNKKSMLTLPKVSFQNIKPFLMNATSIIQRQVEAYNKRDIDAFVACHHPEVELFNFGEATPFAIGREKVREIYGDVFDHSPNLHTEVHHRIVMGNRVIDHETVRGRKGIAELKFVAIYEVEEGMIRKAHFMRE